MRILNIITLTFIVNVFAYSQTYQTLYSNIIGIYQFKSQQLNFDSRRHLLFQPRGLSGAPCIIDSQGANTYKINTRTFAIYQPFHNFFERFVCEDALWETCWTEPFDIICISQSDSNFILGYRKIEAVAGVGNCNTLSIISMKSYDGGITRSALLPPGLILKAIEINPVDDNIIYVSTESNIYKSTDRGNSFNIISQNSNLKDVLRISPFNNSCVFVSDSLGMLVSTNSGANFSHLSVPRFKQMYFYNNKPVVYGAGNSGVYKSNDNGLNWVQLSSIAASCIEINPDDSSVIYIGTDNNGVYRSINSGQTFNHSEINFPNSNQILGLSKDANSGDTIIVCTQKGIYKVWDLQTSITLTNTAVPEKFYLSQNYPNPFNPATNLEFGISKMEFVSLKVYDIRGNEVAALVNENLNAGIFKVRFDGSQLSSGIYFYKLIANDFTDSKPMMLIK